MEDDNLTEVLLNTILSGLDAMGDDAPFDAELVRQTKLDTIEIVHGFHYTITAQRKRASGGGTEVMGHSTNGLTFNTLRDANIHRLEETSNFSKCLGWTPSQWLQALVGEVGELANEMKKLDRGDFDDMEVGKIRDIIGRELADIQTYLDLLAAKLGIDLGEATMAKWNEVSARVGSDIYLAADDWHRRSK